MKDSRLISVVIGIKDWEPERLDLAIRSHLESSIGKKIELIVSDYGSTDPKPIEAICAKYDCIYQYTDADLWSRSRALNVGLSLASCDIMLTTDADIIFAPRTLEATVDSLLLNPNSIVLAQCSDLSKSFTLERATNFPWEEIYADASLRPRWGMGGLCAFNRDTLDVVRGFEERMVVWGAEDRDFVKRCRQAGRFLHWITGSDVGIYHVWHPPFLDGNPNSAHIHEANKKILNEDFTTARNYVGSAAYIPQKPLVSINIASYNRAHLIGDVIKSILNQTVQDFEILIYDDGSDDNTEEVVASFNDPRLRFFPSAENGGVANARNKMIEKSLGQYICVHDDDDVMLPNRLELQLNAMSDGYVGSYGGWVDYDSVTGDMTRQPGKEPFGVPAIAFLGSVLLHPTLMIQTDVMKRIGYEISFRGGSDYNLVFRLALAGYKLNHCGDYVILRRVHGESLTGQSGDKQKVSSKTTLAAFLNNMSNHVEKQLRDKAKKIKNKEIDPKYNELELAKYLSKDMFDHLVDVTNLEGEKIKPVVSTYSAGMEPRHFIFQTGEVSNSQLRMNIPNEQYCQIPKFTPSTDIVEDKIDSNKYILSVYLSMCKYLNIENIASVAILQYSSTSPENTDRIMNAHLHLANSVSCLEHKEVNYIIVDASSYSVASFVAYSIRTMFGSSLHENSPLPAITSSMPVETNHVQELH